MTAEQDWNQFKVNALNWFTNAEELTELLADYTTSEGNVWRHRLHSAEPLNDEEWDRLGGMLLELSQNLGGVLANIHAFMNTVHIMQGGDTPDNVSQLIVPDQTIILP